jgi:hypothetical protein
MLAKKYQKQRTYGKMEHFHRIFFPRCVILRRFAAYGFS